MGRDARAALARGSAGLARRCPPERTRRARIPHDKTFHSLAQVMSHGMTKPPQGRARPKPPSSMMKTPASAGADADTGRFHLQRQEPMVTSMTHSRSVVIDTSPGPRRGSKLPTLSSSTSAPELPQHQSSASIKVEQVVEALAKPVGRRLTSRWSTLELASFDKLKSAVEKSIAPLQSRDGLDSCLFGLPWGRTGGSHCRARDRAWVPFCTSLSSFTHCHDYFRSVRTLHCIALRGHAWPMRVRRYAVAYLSRPPFLPSSPCCELVANLASAGFFTHTIKEQITACH